MKRHARREMADGLDRPAPEGLRMLTWQNERASQRSPHPPVVTVCTSTIGTERCRKLRECQDAMTLCGVVEACMRQGTRRRERCRDFFSWASSSARL